MNVLIAESGSGFGGTAKYLKELVPLLQRKGYSLKILAYGSGPFLHDLERAGWPISFRGAYRFPCVESNLVKTKGLRWINYVIFSVVGFIQLTFQIPVLFLWLKRQQIRLVHLNNEILSHLPLFLASKLAGCHVLCHLHGWRKFTFTERWFVRYVDEFVAISEAGANFFGKQLKNQTVTAIPNGLSVNGELERYDEIREKGRTKLRVDEQTKVIAMVGRIVPWKGHETFLRALSKIQKRQPNTMGIILGHDSTANQEQLKRLHTLTYALGLERKVRFIPWQKDVWSIYAASDVVVHASTEPEPFGFVILEAMFAKRPVIATRGGGASELVVHEDTGYLVTPGQSDELADRIEQLILDPESGKRMGSRGEERARTHFTMSANAEKIQFLYDKLLKDDKLRSELESKSPTMRQNVSIGIKQTMFGIGALRIIRRSISSKVPILMYHRISEQVDPFFPGVTLKTFQNQMGYVARNYRVLSLDELVTYWNEHRKVPRRSLVVTFDDGHAPTWHVAAPVLHHLNIPVTVFLAADPTRDKSLIWTDLLRWWFKQTKIESYSMQMNGFRRNWVFETSEQKRFAAVELGQELKGLSDTKRKSVLKRVEVELRVKRWELPENWLLSEKQIKRIQSNQVRFGAHTMTHPILSRVSNEEARYEIEESKRKLEAMLGEKIKHFAYPNGEPGDFTEVHEDLVREACFQSASTSILGLNDEQSNRYALKRIYASEEPLATFAARLVGVGS